MTETAAKKAVRRTKGTGTTITIDLKDNLDVLVRMRDAAKADDRDVSKWLRRQVVKHADNLIPGGE